MKKKLIAMLLALAILLALAACGGTTESGMASSAAPAESSAEKDCSFGTAETSSCSRSSFFCTVPLSATTTRGMSKSAA